MHGRSLFQTIRLKSPERSIVFVLLLSFFFVAGSFSALKFSSLFGYEAQVALSAYLKDFCEVSSSPVVPLLHSLGIYFLYVTAAFLFGFSPLGGVLIPALSALFGFGATFTVVCFVETFSRDGILPAMALLLPRIVFTLACFLLIGAEALPQATRIAQVTIKQGKRYESVFQGKRYFALFFLCVLSLALGVCCERVLTPVLFRLAMERIS